MKFTLLQYTTQWVVGYSALHPTPESSKRNIPTGNHSHFPSPTPGHLPSVCLFWTVFINDITQRVAFVPSVFHLCPHCSCDWRINILCGYVIVVWLCHICYQFMDTWIVSPFGLLCRMLLTFMYKVGLVVLDGQVFPSQ